MRPHSVVSMLMITPLLGWALNGAAQVPPTPTPTAAPRLVVGARLTQVSGHSVIACTVKDSKGHALRSQTVSVQKAAAVTGPFADWMSKKTTANGQALLPYAQPTYTWYVLRRQPGPADGCPCRCDAFRVSDQEDSGDKAAAKPDGHASTHGDSHAQADGDSFPHGHSDSHADAYADTDSHRHTDAGAECYPDADTYQHHNWRYRH